MCDLKTLVLDTLQNSHAPHGASLTSNPDGNRLVEVGPEALPVIEEVLDSTVIPNLENVDPYYSEFPGLAYVLGAFILIGIKHDEDRILGYLQQAPTALIAKTLGALPRFFYKPYGGYNFGVAPSPKLINFVRTLESNSDENIRTEATAVGKMLRHRLANA